MTSKENKKDTQTPKRKNFVVGGYKGEVRKSRAVWNKVLSFPKTNQADTYVVKKVCAQIPPNQDALAAVARGERPDSDMKNQILYIKIL